MVDDQALARWRLHRFGLVGPGHDGPEEVVRAHLAVQAENHPQASWAVAARTRPGLSEAAFGRCFDAGAILRTHVLRPTWHFVLPDDIGWSLALTGPRVRRAFATVQRDLGIDDATFERTRPVIADAVADGPRTRTQLGEDLVAAGLQRDRRAIGVALADAELEAIVCSGPRGDGEHTYAPFAERAPDARVLARDEAIAELALRYFTGHGPATERDLAYWATMTLTDVRAGIAAAGGQLRSFELGGRTYWHAGEPPPDEETDEPRAHLLQTLDEFHNGYQDSRPVLDVAGIVPRGRPASVGMVLVEAQMVAGMRRTVTATQVRFEVLPFRRLTRDERGAIDDAAERYGRFLDRDPVVTGTA